MAQLKIPLDAHRFATGLTWKDYLAQMGDTRARTEENYHHASLTEDERRFFSGIRQARYALMLAENWCGDVHRNSPMLVRIVEAMPHCELRRLLPRPAPRPDGSVPQQRLPVDPGPRLLRPGLERDRALDRASPRRHAALVRHPLQDDRRRPAGQAGGRAGGVPGPGPGRLRRGSREEPLAGHRQGGPDDPGAPARPRAHTQGVAVPRRLGADHLYQAGWSAS